MNTVGRNLSWVERAVGRPQLEYSLDVAQFPVTVAEFADFVNSDGYRRAEFWSPCGWAWLRQAEFAQPRYWMQPGYDHHNQPVTGVSYWESEAYANFRNARLPNEKEFCLVASNGDLNRFPWGDDDDAAQGGRANLAFFGEFAESAISEVTAFPGGVSASEIWDLLGNTAAWCVPGDAIELSPTADVAVLKGGCSWHAPSIVDASFRDEVRLTTRDNQTGIRLVRRRFGAETARRNAPPSEQPGVGGHSSNRPTAIRPIPRPSRPYRQEGLPRVDEMTWRLHVTGHVQQTCQLSLSELRAFPRVVRRGVFVCVCRWGQANEVAGVSLRDLVGFVRPMLPVGDLFLRQRSVAGPSGKTYETTIRLEESLECEAVLCYELDGVPLTPELGWPLRMVHFGVLGYKQVKCLQELHFTTEFEPGWWEKECQYDPSGTIRPGSILMVGQNPYRLEIKTQGMLHLE